MNAWNTGTQLALLVLLFVTTASGTAAALTLAQLAVRRWKQQDEDAKLHQLAAAISVTGTTAGLTALAYWLK